ncbi:uncharacterized protein LOC135935851 [Cloeon dipterum]|uniref:uncharacterized protein LOC135935851 n=1 Tax=Cloeon dipterum TaxID=197152 RepID=UPI00321FFE14
MTAFFVANLLLGLSSLATSANLTQVFEWPDGFDYDWPSEKIKTQALGGETFKPENIKPRFMAVYGERIFLSLYRYGVPATLVSFPTSTASSAPPKLTPFPSWDMYLNESGNCDKIDRAAGMQVDSVGRLWVLNVGNSNCNGKLLEKNESRIVDTEEKDVCSIALSPKCELRQLYFSTFHSNELYSIPVATLRNGTGTSNPELIGNWTEISAYRMLMDMHRTMYATFMWMDYISSWNTCQPFQQQRFYQVPGLDFVWPFTLSLDQNGTFWVMVPFDERKPKLLKAAKSFEGSPECSTLSTKNDAA